MSSIATMAVNPDNGTTMQEMDYIMDTLDKSEILRKRAETEETMEQDESQASEQLPKRMRIDSEPKLEEQIAEKQRKENINAS